MNVTPNLPNPHTNDEQPLSKPTARRAHCGAQRALGAVLLSARIAEEGHQPVAELFWHVAAEACTAAEASSR